MSRSLIAIAALAVATPCLAQQPSEDKVRSDLQSLLRPGVEFGLGGLDDATGHASFRTRAFATTYTGMCRYDLLYVGYAGPVGYWPEVGAQRVPIGVETQSYYRVLEGVPKLEKFDWATYRPFDGKCATLTGEEDGWFQSGSTEHAASGYQALSFALDDLRAGKRAIPGCHVRGTPSEPCAEIMAAKLPGDVQYIRWCAAKFGESCYDVSFGGYGFRIQLRYNAQGVGILKRIDIVVVGALD
ncbi:MAG: hypothetical protein ACAH11_10770 [Sphingomonas sp.]